MRVVILLLLITLIMSCTTRRETDRVSDPLVRYDHVYFSVIAPGKDWEVIETISKFLFFTREYKISFTNRPSETHTKIAYVQTVRLLTSYDSPEAFKQFVKDLYFKHYNNPRFKIKDNSVTEHKDCGAYCFSHVIAYHDLDVPNKQNAEFLLSEGYEFIMIHPRHKDILLVISYSERGKPGELAAVEASAQRFITTLVLKKID